MCPELVDVGVGVEGRERRVPLAANAGPVGERVAVADGEGHAATQSSQRHEVGEGSARIVEVHEQAVGADQVEASPGEQPSDVGDLAGEQVEVAAGRPGLFAGLVEQLRGRV